jgi:hypothetical protein
MRVLSGDIKSGKRVKDLVGFVHRERTRKYHISARLMLAPRIILWGTWAVDNEAALCSVVQYGDRHNQFSETMSFK